jgi:hypothetical protein
LKAQTYPERRKKILIQKGPAAMMRRRGRWNKWGGVS